MDERAGWSMGALAGSLVAGLAISALMLAKEQQSGGPSDLVVWERKGAQDVGLSTRRGAANWLEQAVAHGGHLALSALGGVAYAAAFEGDAPVVASGLAFGSAFYVACHWVLGPLLRLKPPEWREPPEAVTQHLIVHAAFGVLIAAGARLGARLSKS
ncbi:MAG: hypothetical protein INR64_17785 [Caulobacteraceae bacterium]|nr:hypothetical protein [Caulobacter sp.]